MRRIPPLTSVRAFEAAARHGNFTRAGEEVANTAVTTADGPAVEARRVEVVLR